MVVISSVNNNKVDPLSDPDRKEVWLQNINILQIVNSNNTGIQDIV